MGELDSLRWDHALCLGRPWLLGRTSLLPELRVTSCIAKHLPE